MDTKKVISEIEARRKKELAERNLRVSKLKCKEVVYKCYECGKEKAIPLGEYLDKKDCYHRLSLLELEDIKTEKHYIGLTCESCVGNEELRKIQENNKKLLPVKYKEINTDKEITVQNQIDSMFIYGGVGSGKTVYMASLLKKNKIPSMWLVYPEFIMDLQRDYDGAFEKAEEAAKYSGTLFIDDFGAEKLTDYVRQITYFIINHREQNMLQTYITSNYSLEDIDRMVDERVSSRIAGLCKVVKFTGKDRRINNETIST